MKFLSTNKFIIAALLLCISASLFVFIISVKQTAKVKHTSEEVANTNKVLSSLDKIITATLDVQNGTQGFVITGNEQFLEPLITSGQTYGNALSTINRLEKPNKTYAKKLDSLSLLISRRIETSQKIIALRRKNKTAEAAAIVASGEGNRLTQNIRNICDNIKQSELSLQNNTRTKNEKTIFSLNTILYTTLIIVMLLGVLLFVKAKVTFNEHRAGEEKFRALLESAPDAMLISDNKGFIQLVNREAEKMLGYTKKELTGMSVENLIPSGQRELHAHLRTQYAHSPMTRNMDAAAEMQALKKDGTVIPVEISLSPIETNGEVLVAAALRDISQRKAAQQEIQNLFTQINQASEAIYAVDNNLIIKSWNKGAENLYGFSKEEAVGKQSVQLLKTDLSKEQIEEANAAMTNKGSWSGEIKRKTKSGTEVYVYSSFSAVKNKEGTADSYISVSFDITERKKMVEQLGHLAGIVENSSEAILSRDMGGKIISWNKGAEKMFGYSRDEALGKPVIELDLLKITEAEKQSIEKSILQTGEWHTEKYFYHKNGTGITGAVTANTVKDSNGTVTGLSFAIKDVSERKLLEQHLRDYNNELEEKIKLRTGEIALSETKYRLLYENNPMPMWVFDLETFKFLDVNGAAQKLYGYTKEEFLSMSILDIRSQAEKGKLLKEDHHFEETDAGFNRGIWPHIIKNGTTINVEIFVHSIFFEGHKARLTLVNNVTEKLKTEERLVASEKRFRALIENSYDIITMLDKDFNIIYRSPSAIRVTGRQDDEVIGSDGTKKIHPEDMATVAAGIKRLLAAPGNVEECAFRYRHNDGSYLWMEGNATNLLHDENVKAIVFNYRDVSERRVAQERINTSEKRFRSLIENGSDIINLLDASFKITYRSPSAARMSGLEDADVIGADGRKRIHPDDIETISTAIQRLLAAPGNIEKNVFRYQHRDGHYMWLDGTATNLLHDEAVKAIVFNYREVSERIEAEEKLRASEERFRSALDNMMEGVQIIGFDWKYRYVNNALVKQAKCSKEELLGHSILEKYSCLKETALFKLIRSCMTEGVPAQTEARLVYPDKTVYWFELSIQPVPEGIFILSVDITDKIKAAEALKEEKDKLATIAATSPGLIYSFRMKPDGSFSFPFVSNAVGDIFGITDKEIINNVNPMLQSALEEDLVHVINSIRESALTMSPWQLAFRYKHPVKGTVWLEGNSLPSKETDGSIIWHGILMDITERVNAAGILKEERDKLMKIADTSPGLIYSFRMTADGKFSCPFTSNAVDDIFGITHEAARDNIAVIIEWTDEEDRQSLIDSIQASAKDMKPWQIIFRYNHPEKGKIWLQGNSLPVKETDGSTLWHGIIIDITERKITEEKIIEKSAQLETLSNNLPGIMIYQLSGTNFENRQFSYVSKEVTRLTGKTPEEVIANPLLLYGLIHKGDMARLMKAEMDAFRRMRMFNEEVRCRTADGETRWLNIISTPRKTMDGKMVWDGFHVDITERKKNEAALRNSYMEKRMLAEKLTTILNTLPANIALLDKKGVVIDVNQSWIQFADHNNWHGSNYGIGENYITVAKKTQGKDWRDGIKVAEGISDVLNKISPSFVYEYECDAPDVRRWFRMLVTPMLGDDNTGAVVMHIDITQIRMLEEERIRLKTEEQKIITQAILKGQEKERNAIGKELHDNINQILAGIHMLLGLLTKRPEKLNELLPLCIENVNLAIKENRNLAHELATPDEESENLVEQVKRVTKNMLQNAGIATRISLKNFDESILTKEQKLAAYRIVQEQCNNILKYAKAQKVVVLLQTSNKKFLLILKDNGCGMENGKRTEGIGLQNIKSRVQVLNGTVNITTKPGAGFMLAVEVPLAAFC